jgi:hypothetical protein
MFIIFPKISFIDKFMLLKRNLLTLKPILTMGAITKRDRGFWPKMVQDFFGAENPFDLDEKFWFPERSMEIAFC